MTLLSKRVESNDGGATGVQPDRGGDGARLPGLLTLLVAILASTMIGQSIVHGWIGWPGFDYRAFAAAGRAFIKEGAAATYDLESLARYGREVMGSDDAIIPVAPYPPAVLPILAPFGLLSLPVGFLVWLLVNLAGTLYALHALAARFPHHRRKIVALGVLALPVLDGLLVGQPMALLLLGMYGLYRNLEVGRDGRAGLWGGLLLFKPQYVVLLGLVLLLKRRWRAVAGFAVSGAGLLLVSVLVAGIDGVQAYLRLLSGVGAIDSDVLGINPAAMMTWRGLLVNLVPGAPAAVTGVAVVVLTVLTGAALIPIWRGAWTPSSPRFALQMLATVAAGLLVSYHSHTHGAALLVVPLLAAAATGAMPQAVRVLTALGLVVPPVLSIVLAGYEIVWRPPVAVVLAALALGTVAASIWALCGQRFEGREAAVEAGSAPRAVSEAGPA
ncbi:MAG: glycosyltransferase family 87 protein [Sphaerobacter sp.]|nr:glycosyltransferase family 87 protein [Sphaerobacter sp.]